MNAHYSDSSQRKLRNIYDAEHRGLERAKAIPPYQLRLGPFLIGRLMPESFPRHSPA